MDILKIDKITPGGIRMIDGSTEPATLPNLQFIAMECDNQIRGLDSAVSALYALYAVKKQHADRLNRSLLTSMYGISITRESGQYDLAQRAKQIDSVVSVMDGIDQSIKTIHVTKTGLQYLGQTAKMLLCERGVII